MIVIGGGGVCGGGGGCGVGGGGGGGGGVEYYGCGRFDSESDIGDDGKLLSSLRSDSLQSQFQLFLLTGVSQVIASELQAGGSTVTVCMSAAKLIAPETIKAHTT